MPPILLSGLVFLFPLAFYILFLAYLNARQRATMVAGVWDFVGVLFALSGFLILGGPLIIRGLHEQFNFLMLRPNQPAEPARATPGGLAR